MHLVLRSLSCLILLLALVAPSSATPFLTDSSLELRLRATGENVRTDTGYAPETSRNQSAGVFSLHFASGLFKNCIGVDAVAYHVTPLKYDKKNAANSYGTDETFFQDGKNGFGKCAASIRIAPNDHLLLRYGRMESDHVLLGPGDYRTTPRMYEMASGQIYWEPVTLTLMHVTGGSDYSDDTFHKFGAYKGSWQDGIVDPEPVQIADIRFEKGPFGLKAAHGRQQDILEYTYLEGTWFHSFSDLWNLQTAAGYRCKNVTAPQHEEIDHTLGMVGGQVILTRKNTWIKLALSNVEKNTDFFESIDGTMGTDWVLNGSSLAGCKDNGYYTTGVQGIFNHDGETARKIEIGHDVTVGLLSGLSASAYYVEGRNLHDGSEYVDNMRQREYGGRLAFIPPALPGLTLEIEHGNNTMKSDGEYGMVQKISNTQVNVSYTMTLF
ncbi:OprD family outer membrane porin [Desulfoluna spongiiphila]|uniref:OprD family outer membrane porin n=1 Tax=Desulfoluna spongiiphila TaxID=419481 RepID=UPI00125AA241|nr:OprD family outer membrane porin [Desulfoluna spongiiphila]VVS93916.1 outer membrane porin bacterial [Desulfoluna spongiiphila]